MGRLQGMHLFGFWDDKEEDGDAGGEGYGVADGAEVLDGVQEVGGGAVVFFGDVVHVIDFIQDVVDVETEGHEE